MNLEAAQGHIWVDLERNSKEELIAHIRWLYRYIEEIKK